MSKIFCGTIMAMMLLGLLTLTLKIQPIESWNWNFADEGLGDFGTIQEAINRADAGETIYVHSGVYCERIVVNKSVSLIGEGPISTIVDGGGVGTVVEVTVDFVKTKGFTQK